MSNNKLNLGFKDFLESEPEKFKEFLKDLGLEKLQFDFEKKVMPSNLFDEIINKDDFESKYSQLIEEVLFDYENETYQNNDFAKELEILTKYVGKSEIPKHSEIAEKYIKSSLKVLRTENHITNTNLINTRIDILLSAPFIAQILWRELYTFGLIELEYDKDRDAIYYSDTDAGKAFNPRNVEYMATSSLNSLKFSDDGFRYFYFEVPIEISTKPSLDYDIEIVVESLVEEDAFFKDHYDDQTDLFRLSVLSVSDTNEISFQAQNTLKELIDQELLEGGDWRFEEFENREVYYDKFTKFGKTFYKDSESSSKHLSYSLLSDEKKEYIFDLFASNLTTLGISDIAKMVIKFICLHPRTPSKIIDKAQVINKSFELNIDNKFEYLRSYALSYLIYDQVDKAIEHISSSDSNLDIKQKENLAIIFLTLSAVYDFQLKPQEISFFKSEIYRSHPNIEIDEIITKMEKRFTNSDGEKLNIWAGKLSGGFFLELGKELLKFSEEKALEFLDHSNYFTGRLLAEMQPLEVGNLLVSLAKEAEDSKQFDLYLLAKTFFLKEVNRERVNGSSDPLKQFGLAYLLLGMLDELVFKNEDSALTNYLLGSEAGDPNCNSNVIWILGRQQKYVEVIQFFEKLESDHQNFMYPNVALLFASLAYSEIGEISKSDSLLDFLEHLGDASSALLSTLTWNRFLNDQCQDNSKFKQVIDKFGPSDEKQFINFTSNVILLDLAKSRNYQEALDCWLEISDPNYEVQLYIAACLLILKRENKSKDIIKNFSIIEKWNQIETIKTFESAKGFALEWANKCRTAIGMN
jgi:hypothetical protein